MFTKTNKKWEETNNWKLFLPLKAEDYYCYTTLHIANNNQSDFDKQIGNLVKIIIDSLNEKELNKYCNNDKLNGSINKLEQYFQINNIENYEKHIEFLRNLQELRSSSVAHRKGNNYKKNLLYFNLDKESFSKVFENILSMSNDFLYFLQDTN